MIETIKPRQDSATPLRGTPGHKKKKMWRNLFLLNLTVTLLLVAIFWLPMKAAKIDEFLNSPSVNLPQAGNLKKLTEQAVAQKQSQESPAAVANMLETRVVTLNASSEAEWVFFDFSRGARVNISDMSSKDWDIGFRRAKIITNGGASNRAGHGGVLDLKTKKFDPVTEVPDSNYVIDKATRTENKNPEIENWLKYNFLTHKLTPRKNVYAIRTADQKYAKVQFLNFYCPNDESGCVKFRFVYQDNGTTSFLKSPGDEPLVKQSVDVSSAQNM